MHYASLRLSPCLAVCALLLSGCPFRNYDPVPRDAALPDAALDAQLVDAGPEDPVDARTPDAGMPDAGDVEAAPMDSEYEWHDVRVDTRMRPSPAGTRLLVGESAELWLAFVSCTSDAGTCSDGELVVMRGRFDSGFVEELPAPAIRAHAFDLAFDAEGTLVLLVAGASTYEVYRRDRITGAWSRRILPSAADGGTQAPRLLLLDGRMHALLPRAADTTELVEASGAHRVLSSSAEGACLLYGVWAPETLEALRVACVPRAGATELHSMRVPGSEEAWESTGVSSLDEWAELCGASDLAGWSCAHGTRLTSFGLAPMLSCAGGTDVRLVDQALPLRAAAGCPMPTMLGSTTRALAYQHRGAESAYEALVSEDGSAGSWRLERIASGTPSAVSFASEAGGTTYASYHLCAGTSCGHRVAVRALR